ncbi:MAG: 2-(1,2-epoxy-1,2-dihydrophenyl)acetyl-CoA isomerase PaaG [Bosea sp. (in: a-proteobacteria)]
MAEEAPLKVAIHGHVHVLTLNRPDRLNAFNEAQHRALAAAIADASAPSCRAVLLTGAGRAFCAGQDLATRARKERDPPPDLGQSLEQFYNPLVQAIRSLGKPVVCAVNGVAAGAGANLALACDIVLAARSARFIQSFAKLGLVPDCGGTWMLPRLIGEARAKALALTGEAVSAEDAQAMGMIWRVFDDAQLMPEALALCARLADGPMAGLAAIKQAIQTGHSRTLDQALDHERDTQAWLGLGPEYAEGVHAFLEKRPARFTDLPPDA